VEATIGPEGGVAIFEVKPRPPLVLTLFVVSQQEYVDLVQLVVAQRQVILCGRTHRQTDHSGDTQPLGLPWWWFAVGVLQFEIPINP
jgi:hypothetical protein